MVHVSFLILTGVLLLLILTIPPGNVYQYIYSVTPKCMTTFNVFTFVVSSDISSIFFRYDYPIFSSFFEHLRLSPNMAQLLSLICRWNVAFGSQIPLSKVCEYIKSWHTFERRAVYVFSCFLNLTVAPFEVSCMASHTGQKYSEIEITY
jgi:hypothetical protein